jgi:hypothetical protein
MSVAETGSSNKRRNWGLVPRGQRRELLNVILGSFGAASGIVQIALAVALMCTIL